MTISPWNVTASQEQQQQQKHSFEDQAVANILITLLQSNDF